MGLFPTSDTERYLAVKLNEEARLISLVAPLGQNEAWANGGVYLISPGVLDLIAERFKGQASLENELIPALLELKSAIYGMRHSGRFIDIGLPADYRRAAAFLRPLS